VQYDEVICNRVYEVKERGQEKGSKASLNARNMILVQAQ
jgi:hypothetical protein